MEMGGVERDEEMYLDRTAGAKSAGRFHKNSASHKTTQTGPVKGH
jgi:hypothetical protein